jgi:hypothetical protein
MAAMAVIARVWRRFLSMYLRSASNSRRTRRTSTSWRKGVEAGIGPHSRAAADMIAVRVMGPMKVAVVGAPEYFAQHSPPRTPDDLARHS